MAHFCGNGKGVFKRVRIAILFVLFGLICMAGNLVFMSIVFLNLHKFKAVTRFSRTLVKLSWGAFISSLQYCKFLTYSFDVKFKGGGNLIVANHPSLLDVVFFISKIDNLNCVVKAELSKNIFLSLAISACGYIKNSENEELLKECEKVLKDGENLLIFPEGTRTKESIKFHKAAFFIAIKNAKNLVPVTIKMNPRSLKKAQKWYDTPNETIKYEFKSCDVIKIDEFNKTSPDPLRVRTLKDEIMKCYKEIV